MNSEQHPVIYLACPYSHESERVMQLRFEFANWAASEMMKAGFVVFSPISQNHPIATSHGLPRGWEFWKKFDRAMLSRCDAMVVMCLPGWQESNGVKAEIVMAREISLDIIYLDLDPSKNY